MLFPLQRRNTCAASPLNSDCNELCKSLLFFLFRVPWPKGASSWCPAWKKATSPPRSNKRKTLKWQQVAPEYNPSRLGHHRELLQPWVSCLMWSEETLWQMTHTHWHGHKQMNTHAWAEKHTHSHGVECLSSVVSWLALECFPLADRALSFNLMLWHLLRVQCRYMTLLLSTQTYIKTLQTISWYSLLLKSALAILESLCDAALLLKQIWPL